MTAKVASPASGAEDLACTSPLKAKRSLYTEDQLSFTHKNVANPHKARAFVVCVSFMGQDSPVISTSVALCTFLMSFSLALCEQLV